MFSSTVSENRNTSCITVAILLRRAVKSQLPDVDGIKSDGTAGHIIETAQKVDNG